MIEERLQKVALQPLHQYLGVSGLESDNGRGALSFVVEGGAINPAGALHGGVVYALCDVCAYAGLVSILPPDQEAVTHDIHVSMLRAARPGDTVRMESQVVKIGKTLCFIDVSARVGERLIALARITKSLVPAGG